MRTQAAAGTFKTAALLLALCLAWAPAHPAWAQDTGSLFAEQLRTIELISSMESALFAASEAEKLAVMAEGAEESETYAEMTRSIAASLEKHRLELAAILNKAGQDNETALLNEFGKCWADYRKLDERILALAVKNTNLEAARLSHGKAREQLTKFREALALVAPGGDGREPDARIQILKDRAVIAAQDVQILQAPHIIEPEATSMDAFEARMTTAQAAGESALKELEGLVAGEDAKALGKARAAWDEYRRTTAGIVALSRENTNVDSLKLSLGRKRAATATCSEILTALKKTALERYAKATR